MAGVYTALEPGESARTLIVMGTNEARREINANVWEVLGTAGKGIKYDTLVCVDTTQAKRRHSRNYRAGYMIQPERDLIGLE